MVARRLARTTGWWYGSSSTPVPSRIRSRGRGDEAQAVERIGVGQRRRELKGPDPGAGIQHDVLRQVQRLEAAVLGMPGVGHDPVGVDAVVGRASS